MLFVLRGWAYNVFIRIQGLCEFPQLAILEDSSFALAAKPEQIK